MTNWSRKSDIKVQWDSTDWMYVATIVLLLLIVIVGFLMSLYLSEPTINPCGKEIAHARSSEQR